MEIERAHRVRSNDTDKCTVIVKFTKCKDRECVINKTNTVLNTIGVYWENAWLKRDKRDIMQQSVMTN